MMRNTFYQDSLNWGHMYTLNYPSSMPANNKAKFELTTEQFWNIGNWSLPFQNKENLCFFDWLLITHACNYILQYCHGF